MLDGASPLAPVTLPLVDLRRERVERVDQAQQALSAVLLVLASTQRLRAPGHAGWGWAIVELVMAATLAALSALVMAFVRVPLVARRRVLQIDGQGVRLRVSRVRRSYVEWAGTSALRVADGDLCFTRADGTEQWLRLRRLGNRAEVIALVIAHARARGLPVTGTTE